LNFHELSGDSISWYWVLLEEAVNLFLVGGGVCQTWEKRGVRHVFKATPVAAAGGHLVQEGGETVDGKPVGGLASGERLTLQRAPQRFHDRSGPMRDVEEPAKTNRKTDQAIPGHKTPNKHQDGTAAIPGLRLSEPTQFFPDRYRPRLTTAWRLKKTHRCCSTMVAKADGLPLRSMDEPRSDEDRNVWFQVDG